MPLNSIAAFGWERCARLANRDAELIVTLDVGPRILSFKTTGGENVLRAFPKQLGKSGEPDYQVRGGHRMWIGPEDERTYAPDNGPTEFRFDEPCGLRVATPATEPWKIRKEMIISLAAEGADVHIRHRATNEGAEPATLCTWGLTVPIPGGCEIIPQPPLGEHGKGGFQPDRVIVPWSYTDLSDDRWRIGARYWRLRPNPERPATKLGFALTDGWVAYVLPGALFIKRFDFDAAATYPDRGCNFETFSKGDFIELESLSPLRTLAPGESTEHAETWHLFADTPALDSLEEGAIERWLQPFLAKIGSL
jgi:hypothetical protein